MKAVNAHVQKEEAEIFKSNNCNLDLPLGSSILKMILKLTNDSYDFSTIINVVNSYASEAIFLKFK